MGEFGAKPAKATAGAARLVAKAARGKAAAEDLAAAEALVGSAVAMAEGAMTAARASTGRSTSGWLRDRSGASFIGRIGITG
jgi:hypothetical protein